MRHGEFNKIAASNAGERLSFRCAAHVSWPGVAELFMSGGNQRCITVFHQELYDGKFRK